MGLPAAIHDPRVPNAQAGPSVSLRLALFLALLLALVNPLVGLLIACLALTWLLLGVYERL